MAEPQTSVYFSGQYYSGEFISTTPRFRFRDPVRDERAAFLVEIEASRECHVLALKWVVGAGITWFYRIQNGALVKNTVEPNFGASGITHWYLTGHHTPAYLIFYDENGDFRYVYYDADPTGNLIASSQQPAGRQPQQGQWVGQYWEILDHNGFSFYRMTVNSSNTISFTHHRDEPWRVQTVCLSQGMPDAYKGGRTYIEAIRHLSDIDMRVEEIEWGYGGTVIPRAGTIDIELGDEMLDWLASQRWDSREITIYSGSTTVDPLQWPIVFRSQTQSVDWTEDVLTITLRDYATYFDRSIQPNTYLGTGFHQGSEEVAGVVKPLAYGTCRHVTPVLFHAQFNAYQVNDGPIRTVSSVWDRGVQLTALGDITSLGFSTVYDWTPGAANAGQYITDLSRGIFRLGAPAAGRITANIVGTTAMGSANTIAAMVRAIAQSRIPEISLDATSFDAHEFRIAQHINFYITQERTVGDVFHEIMSRTGGALGIDRLGNLFIKQLERRPPRTHITELDVRASPGISRVAPPKPGRSYRGGYTRSWTVLTPEEVSEGAHFTIKSLLAHEFRYSVINQVEPYLRHESAKTIDIDMPFDFPIDATFWLGFIAGRQQVLRHVYEVPVEGMQFELEIGDMILLEYPRFDLHLPREGLIVGITEKLNEQVTMLFVWTN